MVIFDEKIRLGDLGELLTANGFNQFNQAGQLWYYSRRLGLEIEDTNGKDCIRVWRLQGEVGECALAHIYERTAEQRAEFLARWMMEHHKMFGESVRLPLLPSRNGPCLPTTEEFIRNHVFQDEETGEYIINLPPERAEKLAKAFGLEKVEYKKE